MAENQLRKTPKWKSSGPDHVNGYWLKSFSKLHEIIAMQLDEILSNGETPEWMTKGRTRLIQKDESKGNDVSNFRPITCLPLM